MYRDLNLFQDSEFDVLVIGAGIYGSAIAWDAALRGLSVALIENADFGGGTSANSLKTIHGGLRYLQQLDIKRMRESILERRTLMGIAPHLVHPLTVLMPTYGHMMKGREALLAGLILNDIISFDRNRLGDPQKRIPPGRIVSKKRCLELVPCIDRAGVTGGAMWTDAQMYNSERMCLAFVQSAVDRGAVVANYVKGEGLLTVNGRVEGIRCRDMLTGTEFEIMNRMVVNAAGGWMSRFEMDAEISLSQIQWSTAMNLIVNRPLVEDFAAGLFGRFKYPIPGGGDYEGRRVLFFAPWRGHTIIGTYHRPYDGDADDMGVSEKDITEFLKEVNSACPGDPVRREEVSFFHKGFLPMDGIHPKTGDVVLTKHYRITDHAAEDGTEGLISVAGVKYTTARDVAEKVVDRVCSRLGMTMKKSQTAGVPLSGGRISQFGDFLSKAMSWSDSSVNRDVLRHLVYSYGSDYPRLLEYKDEDPEWLALVPGSKEVIGAEILHGVREEMAVKLADVVLRRTDLGSAAYPGDDTLATCAEIMGKELGWDRSKVLDEIEEVKAIYTPKA